ncbi:beta-lactamase/transpeptidase-like protein [Aspergillus desertorum]
MFHSLKSRNYFLLAGLYHLWIRSRVTALCLPQIHQIHSICQVPSITFGVIHRGRLIIKKSIGHRDSGLTLRANEDTIYMLGSCSKMFTSAAVAILKHLPAFNPEGDPRIGQQADIIDCLRHTTGLSSPTVLTIGPRGTIVSDEEDLIPILNAMPTENGEQRFNREWLYNNAAVGLMALIVERVSENLKPLGLSRTAMTRADIENDSNIAVPCTRLSNGQFYQLPDTSWPCDRAPLLAGMGMRSSLNDMLTWCIAMTRVRRGSWTRPSDDPEFSKAAAYGIGWFRVDLPSSQLSSFGGNALSEGKEHQLYLQHILGKKNAAAPFSAVGHTGGMQGSIFSVYTFPEAQSAVVTATNGRDLGDASDFTAQILIQALFGLQPWVDLQPWAMKEAELARDRMLYVGDYRGFNDRFTLSILSATLLSTSPSLSVMFNHRPASECPLVFYQTDVYSFFQPDEDWSKMQAIIAKEYQQTLLKFRVDKEGKAEGLWWRWDLESEPSWLRKLAPAPQPSPSTQGGRGYYGLPSLSSHPKPWPRGTRESLITHSWAGMGLPTMVNNGPAEFYC